MKDRRPYSRHGLNALKARVKVRGLAAIDRRTAAARALLVFREGLIRDVGSLGWELSAQTLALVDLASRTKLYLDTLDAWLMEQTSLVNSRSRSVLPVLRERMQLADALVRYLVQMGISTYAASGQDEVEEGSMDMVTDEGLRGPP